MAPDLPQRSPREVQMEHAHTPQPLMNADGDPTEVLLARRMSHPVVARKTRAALEDRRHAIHHRRIANTGLPRRLHIPGDELRLRNIRLQRDIRAADLRVAAGVGLEQLRVDTPYRLEQRRRLLERRRPP